jgi:hypothetical protein
VISQVVRAIHVISTVLILKLIVGCSPSVSEEPTTEDLQILDALRATGADMDAIHGIEFVAVFEMEAEARLSRAKLEDEDFYVSLMKYADPSRPHRSLYQLSARVTIKPTPEAIGSARAAFQRITGRHHGRYDGWGTEPVMPKGSSG